MITLSLNFDGNSNKTSRVAHERVREIVDSHIGFPGSDKLKWGLTIKDNGASSVTFAGPREVVSEAKRLWKENFNETTKKTTAKKSKKTTVRAKVKTSAAKKKKK